ncbi:MAG: hypothetical protein QOD06_3156 [Candidatus Binatota bacterium]|jgi:hypothetical protein|nr:hypothetical protein [Candidatus Binatota bacterium]
MKAAANVSVIESPKEDQPAPSPLARAQRDSVVSLLPEGTILPAQVARRSRHLASGSFRLMTAVLEDAVGCFCHAVDGARRARDWEEAASWIYSEDRSWPFSFLQVCEALDLDATWVRKRIAASRERERPAGERSVS